MGKTLVMVAVGVVALILVGWLIVSLLGTILKLAFFLLIGAAVVGGGLYLARRARTALRDGRFKQLR